MKYLVTGASGFIGSYLVELLIKKGHKVCALGRNFKLGYVESDNLNLSEGSILESDYLDKVVLDYDPDIVFHLAAQSSPGLSLANPSHTFQVNTIGTINLLESLKKLDKKPKIILSSSSAVYSPSLTSKAINEKYPINPSSAYGLSKYNMEQIAKMYIEQADMDIVIARPFFLIGPRKIDDVCSSLGRGIVDIESGDKKTLEVGNLKIVRDFLDIRDGAKALSIISEKGISGESYNISSGKGFAIRNILDIFKEGSESRVIEIINPKIIRSIDDPFRIGNPLKLRSLGWKPEYKIEQSVSDILEYWRKN